MNTEHLVEVTEAGILNVKKNCRDDLILTSQLLICIDIIQYLCFGMVRSSRYSNASQSVLLVLVIKLDFLMFLHSLEAILIMVNTITNNGTLIANNFQCKEL